MHQTTLGIVPKEWRKVLDDMVHAYLLRMLGKWTTIKTRFLIIVDMASLEAHCTPIALYIANLETYKGVRLYLSVECQMVDSRAKVQSHKTRNKNKPVEPKSHTQKPGRQIAIGQRFSPKKSSAVHEKPNTPRSCLRWKPTGRIFKIAGLRWIPTGKMFTDNTTKVDSEPPNGSNGDITNPYECDQTLNVSAGTTNSSAVQASLFNDKMTSVHISSSLALQRHMASADNTSGPVPQSKERCTLQCALSLEEEKSSCL
ncbi:hypothetical protein Tco_0491840 [Tanacetum coccineum]